MDFQKTVSAFNRASGNGLTMSTILNDVIGHCLTSGDSSLLGAVRAARVTAKDSNAIRNIDLVGSAIWSKYETIKDKKTGKTIIKTKGSKKSQKHIDELAKIAGSVSMRGSIFASHFSATPKVEPFEFVPYSQAQLKIVNKKNPNNTPAQNLDLIIASFQALRSSLVVETKEETKETVKA